jgi:hypothetical protein
MSLQTKLTPLLCASVNTVRYREVAEFEYSSAACQRWWSSDSYHRGKVQRGCRAYRAASENGWLTEVKRVENSYRFRLTHVTCLPSKFVELTDGRAVTVKA